jgi:uncharacterized protein YdcH (DUF465 family)
MKITLCIVLFLLVLSLDSGAAGYANRSARATDTTGKDQAVALEQMNVRALTRLNDKYSGLTREIKSQSAKTLDAMEKQEMQLKDKLQLKDTMAAKKLFGEVKQDYDALRIKLASPVTTVIPRPLQEYIPKLDSLQTVMRFLGQPGNGIAGGKLQQFQQLSSQLGQLEGKWQQAGQVQDFIRQREQQLSGPLTQYGMGGQLVGMNKQIYYYQQQLANYKQTLSDPGKMGQAAIGIAQKIPFFQRFMQKNSYMGQLCPMPSNYGTPQALTGVPTSADIGKLIAQKMGTADKKIDPQQYLQQQADAGQDQLSALKNKVANVGGSSSDMEIPQFTPNTQKTKSFLHRMEYGFNVQTLSSSTYLPVTTQLAATLGYRLSDKATIGVGASYIMGWGTSLDHIVFSSQGLGLRSYLDVKAKGSIWITGGFEYNYLQAFSKWADLENFDVWQKSALLGLTKKYKLGNKTGNLQLLYDFLARSQTPQAAALKFRVGYTF